MAGGFASPQVVVVQGRQIVVNERIGMNELDSASGELRVGNIFPEDSCRLEAQDGTNSFSAGKNGSSSASTAIRSSSKKSGSFIGRERQDLPISEHYSLLKPSASKGSATIFPSAFFKRISTRPSASSSCFWHSLDRPTPSSNSLMASSKESCGLSSLRTTSSRRVSD